MIALAFVGVCILMLLCCAFLIGWIAGWKECEKAEADHNNRKWRQSDGE